MSKARMTNCLVVMCAVATAFLAQVPLVQAELVTFDGPGYNPGATPPAPWTDRYTAIGTPYSDLVYQVVAGAGVGGSQALTVLQNPYSEGAAVYVLATPLTSGAGPQRVSVMLDPSQNGMSNFAGFGGVTIGRGGWFQDSTAAGWGIYFGKQDWGYHGGDQPTDFRIMGSGGTVIGYFVPSAAQNYYEIAFDINAAFTSILITVTAPDGTIVAQTTTGWDGGAINKVWLSGSDETYNGQPVYYDNLKTTAPEPAACGDNDHPYPSMDLNQDCLVDLADFALFASQWLRYDCVTPDWCEGADFDMSGDVAMEDLAELVTLWLTDVRP